MSTTVVPVELVASFVSEVAIGLWDYCLLLSKFTNPWEIDKKNADYGLGHCTGGRQVKPRTGAPLCDFSPFTMEMKTDRLSYTVVLTTKAHEANVITMRCTVCTFYHFENGRQRKTFNSCKHSRIAMAATSAYIFLYKDGERRAGYLL
jgi:hypothetical protein